MLGIDLTGSEVKAHKDLYDSIINMNNENLGNYDEFKDV